MQGRQKLLFALVAIFILVGFFFVLFHHHPDGEDHRADCIVCRLVQYLVGLFALALIALISLIRNFKGIVGSFLRIFISLLLSSSLRDRAPPVLA